ncbi:MAG: hypothetical protein J6A63_04165, partial [Clostridia bacterium]|nr:hypothetical protein [Clostridia bacterium]
MNKKKAIKLTSIMLSAVMTIPVVLGITGCNDPETPAGKKKDSIVIMTEELSGLFNPFYATSGADMDVVGMTQIGMLSTDREGNPEAGDDLPTVVKDFEVKTTGTVGSEKSVYTFVLKNGLEFSDGKPLTMNDVMFNIYEYLDPVYTGSSTMYSIDIQGLTEYRTQMSLSESAGLDEKIASNAAKYAQQRIGELVKVYQTYGRVSAVTGGDSYRLTKDEMLAAIDKHTISAGYKMAVVPTNQIATTTDAQYRQMLKDDYELTLKTFKEELESDYKAAKESYDLNTAPYKDWKNELSSDIFKFFLYEGYITPVYEKISGTNRDNKEKIKEFYNTDIVNSYSTQEAAIQRVYEDKSVSKLHDILSFWGTAGTLKTLYAADATDVILHTNMGGSEMKTKNISGIVSLGHTTNTATVKVNGKDYMVAQEHNEDGTPKNSNEYDVLQITVNGIDPKAIYNFGFTVAPAHYYASANGTGTDVDIDIANNKFGVEFASSDFQSKVIQSQRNVEVPVGAGAFMATNADNGNNPSGAQFWNSNIVYFKKNDKFMFDVKADKLRLQVVSASNAIDKLASGEVDYITPQFTKANSERLTQMKADGYERLDSWQLGYGYIGINAGKVPNIWIRRAIMAAMQTSLALDYYETGTCTNIDWPMSLESWAYPREDDGETPATHNKVWAQWIGIDNAKTKIAQYMQMAGVSANSSELKITFTIAGASITEHPTYTVFKQAAEILNSLDWNVEVKADSQALTKLATGSLAVWAAAWGSTIDPD